jgi:hypothetical protein
MGTGSKKSIICNASLNNFEDPEELSLKSKNNTCVWLFLRLQKNGKGKRN